MEPWKGDPTKLEDFYQEHGMSQAAFAAAAGSSQPMVNRFLNFKRNRLTPDYNPGCSDNQARLIRAQWEKMCRADQKKKAASQEVAVNMERWPEV